LRFLAALGRLNGVLSLRNTGKPGASPSRARAASTSQGYDRGHLLPLTNAGARTDRVNSGQTEYPV
jgi:hypothetical protein